MSLLFEKLIQCRQAWQDGRITQRYDVDEIHDFKIMIFTSITHYPGRMTRVVGQCLSGSTLIRIYFHIRINIQRML